MLFRIGLFGAAILLVNGCATTSTGAMPAGNGTYVVSRQAGAFPSGREPLLPDALIEANLTCYNLKKQMKLISTSENTQILMNFPKATVIFSCE